MLFVLLFVFFVVLFYHLSVLFFCFVRWPKRLYFCNFGGFCLLCSSKRPVFTILLFFILFFFLVFLLSSLSKFHIVLCFLSSTPFLILFVWGRGHLSFFFCLFLCYCLLVSLKQTFLTSPFWNQSCFHFRLFLLFFCCVCFCFHGACFCLSVFMLALFLVCLSFVIILSLFGFLLCFQTMRKHCFPYNYRVFWVMLVTR